MRKIAFSMTVPSALRAFMADHVRALAKDHEVTVFCNFSDDDCSGLFDSGVKLVHIPFAREIRPLQDLKCLFLMVSNLRKGDFVCIHSIMPKTGLLTMMAGKVTGIPVRIHMFTGQVWVTRSGLWRWLLKFTDRIIARFATDVYADSPSQRDFLVSERVIKSGKVLGDGSVNGVDCTRFVPDCVARRFVRNRFGIPDNAMVFGFMGRLNHDKGIFDLVEAFASSEALHDAHLLLVGADEENIEQMVRQRFSDVCYRTHFVGHTSEPQEFYAAFDVFCIPSYREGFGSSVIEAGACGVPALASRIYGLTDAVVEGETGLMHEPQDVVGIRAGLERYTADPEMRQDFAETALRRVRVSFTTQRLVNAMLAEYERLLGHA